MATLRIQLSDKTIARLPTPGKGRYIVRDSMLSGFFLLVGRRKKAFMIQADLRKQGKRASTVRVAIGDSTEISTRTARAIAREYLAQIGRGLHPRFGERTARRSKISEMQLNGNTDEEVRPTGITLLQAWERYRLAMERKNRSERTIASSRSR